jgi:S-adenosylmethionine:tRNA ribosyltransferase-isomerase
MFDIIPEEYFYQLPEDRIAQYPLEERDSSKLLLYRNGEIADDVFSRLDNYIPEGSLLVFNNTRVIRARLIFHKDSGARIEVFCLEPLSPSEYSSAFSSTGQVEWKCLIGNLKKWRTGILETSFINKGRKVSLRAEKLREEGDSSRIRFSWDAENLNFGDVIESAGHVPLPPYIDREDEKSDGKAYQTIYSLVKGSVAAPTAGLHFTRRVLDGLDRKGITRAELTLHVGAGTFQPVKSKRISEHLMHTEHFFVSRKAVESVLVNPGKIIAVGTTSVRTLESLYWLGVKLTGNISAAPEELFVDQWEPYKDECNIPAYQALETLLEWMVSSGTVVLQAPTRIIIVPGYRFRIIDGMITNFHQPGSTLLLLVSAWTGDNWKKIYDYALANDYRFLSYGDSSLLLR